MPSLHTMYILHSHCTCHRKSFAFLISKHLSKSEEQTSLTLVRFPLSCQLLYHQARLIFFFVYVHTNKKMFIQWFMFGVAKTKLNANLCNEMCGFPFCNFIFVYDEKNCDHYITHISFTNPILFYFLCFHSGIRYGFSSRWIFGFLFDSRSISILDLCACAVYVMLDVMCASS